MFLKTFVEGLDAAKATCGLKAEYSHISREFLKRWPIKLTDIQEELAQELADDPKLTDIQQESAQELVDNPKELQALAEDRRRKLKSLAEGHQKNVSHFKYIFEACTDYIHQ